MGAWLGSANTATAPCVGWGWEAWLTLWPTGLPPSQGASDGRFFYQVSAGLSPPPSLVGAAGLSWPCLCVCVSVSVGAWGLQASSAPPPPPKENHVQETSLLFLILRPLSAALSPPFRVRSRFPVELVPFRGDMQGDVRLCHLL